MYIMDEHVQRNENKKHRKLVRSYDQISSACDVMPSPTGGATEANTRTTSPSMTMVFPPAGGLAVNSSSNTTAPLAMLQSPKTPSPNAISPQTLSRSFEQAVAQSPPKYQMYHQFSRKSNTTQQFLQRQQQLQHQSSPQAQLPSPTLQHLPLSRKASLTHPTPAEPSTDPRNSNFKSPGYYHYSIQQSKPMDQRSNNPFILNFNNISGPYTKNSPPSSHPPCSSSPTTASSNPAPTVPTRRSRSLLLKSSSPLQQPNPPISQLSTPLASTPGPPVPPRLSKSPTPTKETATPPPQAAFAPTTTTSTATDVSSTLTAPTITTSTGCYATLAPSPAPSTTITNHNPVIGSTFSSTSATTATTTVSSSEETSTSSAVRKKRDDFLKATMRICLVVSPPSCKLQIHKRTGSTIEKTLSAQYSKTQFLYKNNILKTESPPRKSFAGT